jgi:hypothetical protein
MANFCQEILHTDFEPLHKLADQWRSVHQGINGLDKRMHDEVLAPLKNKGYWEGAAAPYAWRMIDDIQRQLASAATVAAAVASVIDDAAAELKAVKSALRDAIQRAEKAGLHVYPDGSVSPSATDGQCTVAKEPSEAKSIAAAAQEIAALLQRGIAADQNLTFALMADVGLGTWFNTAPKHNSIDTTNKISDAEYNAYARVLRGRDPYPGFSSDTPYSLGADWVSGAGPREREYWDGDPMTELIRSSVSMEQLRRDTLTQWQSEGKTDGTVSYSISEGGKLGALQKLVLTDLPAIVTNDEDHLGEAFMGSYSLDYQVHGRDPDGTLIVQYTLKNNTSNESFLHYVGYYDWLENFNREDGVFSTVSQKITWTERIPTDR